MLTVKTLTEYFESAHLPLTPERAERLCRYADILVEKNKVMNLTAITDDGGIAVKHFIDSILPLTMVEFPENAMLIDVGAGAGFPSVPMCVYRQDLRAVMLDATKKRVDFLCEVIKQLGLDASAVHARAEEYKDGRERFDIAVARAVSRLNVLCEYCLPFVKAGGKFVALKGRDGREEANKAKNAVNILGGKISDIISYTIPGGDERTLIIIDKIKPTPPLYPRASAKIAKAEL